LRRGLATAKAAAGGRPRQSAFAEVCWRFRQRHPGGTADTLERIRVRQSEQLDFAEAMDRVERDPTLKAPGASVVPRVPVTDPKAVLDRLKARRGTAAGSEKSADRATT